MRVRIHRGTAEIGGSCIEVAADNGSRIVLDVGRPLSAGWDDKVDHPPVPGFAEADPSLAGVIISHPHLDHYGLFAEIPSAPPVYIGREAAAVLKAAAFFSPITRGVEPAGFLEHREPFTLGSFTVTPFLNDHSAFDAYSMVIEADEQRLFYSGDIRAHGRKAAMFDELLARPPGNVDVMLMEGTHVRADGSHDDKVFETESQLEERFVSLCRETKGAVVVFGSAQNLDRLVTVYRAAKKSGRELVVDLYGATVAAATRETIPQPDFPSLRVYVPQRQRVLVKESGEFERVNKIREQRVFAEELAATPERFVFHVPSSTARELVKHAALTATGVAVWSLWDGYLKMPSGKSLRSLLTKNDIALTSIHTSGHASVPDLRRLVEAINPNRVVPVHSEATDRFSELFPNVEHHIDGEWWDV